MIEVELERWVDAKVNVRVDAWVNGWKESWISERWTDRWVHECIDRWMDMRAGKLCMNRQVSGHTTTPTRSMTTTEVTELVWQIYAHPPTTSASRRSFTIRRPLSHFRCRHRPRVRSTSPSSICGVPDINLTCALFLRLQLGTMTHKQA